MAARLIEEPTETICRFIAQQARMVQPCAQAVAEPRSCHAPDALGNRKTARTRAPDDGRQELPAHGAGAR